MQLVLLFVCLIKSQSALGGLRIFGGRDANENEFPYVVAVATQIKKKDKSGEIRTKYLFGCSGTLISPTWCLTAAHCIDPDISEHLKTFPQEIKAVLTNRDLSKISEITWGVIHTSYKDLAIYPSDDIGLYRSEPMILTQYAKLSAVEFTTLTGLEGTSVGYGVNQTTSFKNIITTNLTLRVLKIVIIRCPKQLNSEMRGLCISHMCAKAGSACQRDSGSPLVHASGVIGVMSMGYPECKKSKEHLLDIDGMGSGVSVPISPYIDWISRIMTEKT